MRAIGWPSRLGPWLLAALALALPESTRAAEAAAPAPDPTAAAATKTDPRGYQVLGNLAVMDQGRVKPLDTLATARVKSIYSRSIIKLRDEHGQVHETWGPVAALLDWSVRPDHWNSQEIILVEYLPLKRKLLAANVQSQIEAALGRPNLAAADREALQSAAKQEEFTEADVTALATRAGLAAEDQNAFKRLAHKLSADNKWLSADDLNASTVDDHGHSHAFVDWFREIVGKQQDDEMSGSVKLEPLEQKAAEVGMRLFHYEAIRDRNAREIPRMDINVLPHPSNEAYLTFLGEAALKEDGFTALDRDARAILGEFLESRQAEDRAIPGQPITPEEGEGPEQLKLRTERQAKVEKDLIQWLHEKADWVPLRIVLETEEAELARAGFPIEKVQAFRSAYEELETAAQESPNRLPVAKAQAVLAAGRDLGTAVGKYPTAVAMERESHFNRFAPFYKAPMAFGLAVLMLVLALGMPASRDGKSATRGLGSVLYGVGMAALVAGILLEVYGFYLRVHISGWAPVTNMYETVIWVALVASVIGLILELLSRRIFPALAASGVALLTTVLAANVPLLDPTISSLQPVLRSNYWLTIHVLTIVSSYAAFALGLGLGMLAVATYLTASYRRSPSFAELASPLLPGLPLLAVGVVGVYGSYHGWMASFLGTNAGFYAVGGLAAVGGMLSIASIYGLVGELANRKPSMVAALGGLLLVAGGLGAAAGMAQIGPRELALTASLYTTWITAIVGLSWMLLALFGTQARATLRAAMEDLSGRSEAADFVEEPELVGAGASASRAVGGATATVRRPSVAEIRARVESSGPATPDARTLSMQVTAARIKPLSNFIYRSMQVGVLLCAAGTILGGVWADYSWGRFWGWDPKEVWALITLLVYLVPLHGRFAGWVNTFGMVFASVVCFLSVLMAWYGVNFVLGVGLHSYGFVEGGGQGIVVASSLAVIAVACGAYWRRKLASQTPATLA